MESDPRFGLPAHLKARERLVREPRGGNAWHADHVTAVYEVSARLPLVSESRDLSQSKLGHPSWAISAVVQGWGGSSLPRLGRVLRVP